MNLFKIVGTILDFSAGFVVGFLIMNLLYTVVYPFAVAKFHQWRERHETQE